jgi:hypothetical protein
MTLTTTAATRMNATMPTRTQSTGGCLPSSFWIGEKRCCCIDAGDAAHHHRNGGRDEGLEHLDRAMPRIHIIVVVVSPTTLPARPHSIAATIAAR